nr:uncharacterized protein LOC128697409 [Cherax quadricarinatus]
MERPLPRQRLKDDPNDFGWAPRASQLASQPTSLSSPARQEERERRRRRRRSSGERERETSGRRDGRSKSRGERVALPTDYRGALSKFSPPVPHALLKKIGTKEVQGLGKVCEEQYCTVLSSM